MKREQELRGKKKYSPGTICFYIVLCGWAVTTIYPFLWVFMNSFKPRGEIRNNSFSLPVGDLFTTENYAEVFNRMKMGNAYINSIVISAAVTVIVLLLAGFTAYGLSRYRFKGRGLVRYLIIGSMMFPMFAVVIPVFRMEHAWGIVNTDNLLLNWISVIFPQAAGNIAFGIIVLMGFINSIPLDLEEAAYIEGYNVYQIYWKVVMPLIKPSLATVGIFSFLWSYNDLFTQMFFLRYEEYQTVTLVLNKVTSKAGTNYGVMAAAVVLVVIPVLIMYLLMQKNIVKGLTAGAIKG